MLCYLKFLFGSNRLMNKNKKKTDVVLNTINEFIQGIGRYNLFRFLFNKTIDTACLSVIAY